jgi:2-polyprenyl-3-methyl-5-hydroxy-6-metoxy-1,4-benzoquinol methylase
MNIFPYGTVYAKLPSQKLLRLFLNKKGSLLLSSLARLYIRLFGYPDVAGQMRYRLVTKTLKPRSTEKILDAGCGNGSYVFQYSKDYHIDGYGVDAREEKISRAKKINSYLGFNASFTRALLENNFFKNEKFDKIICLEVLEHIRNDSLALQNISQHLKKGGYMIITVPMKGTALDPIHDKNPNYVPKKYEHVRSGYKVNEIKRLLKDAKLKSIFIRPYFYLFSQYAVLLQTNLNDKQKIAANIILSPVLTLISYIDYIYKIKPRGLFVFAQKT